MTSQMSLFEHFFKVLSLYMEARIRNRIPIKVKGRIRIRIRIKVTSRIRIRIKVMRIRNIGCSMEIFLNWPFLGSDPGWI